MARRKAGQVTRTAYPTRRQDGLPLDGPMTAAVGTVTGDLATHVADVSNPHATTAAQVGAPTTAAFETHHARHENGGADEMSVAGLSGELADPQPPKTHASSHASAGGDAIKLDDLAAPDDNTDLDASTAKHGLAPKGTAGTTQYWRQDWTLGTPSGSGSGAPTVQRSSATGTQNDFSLSASFTYLICDGAAPVFNGFSVASATPSDGDRVVIDYIGTGTCKVATQAAGSTAAYRIICPSTNGQIIGPSGRMELVYDATTARWREHVVDPGDWIPVAYTSGDFTASGSMTWTVQSGDLLRFAYRQRGIELEVALFINTSTVGGTAAPELRWALPAGFTGRTSSYGWQTSAVWAADNGVYQAAFMIAGSGSTYVSCYRATQANWTLSTDNTVIGFAGILVLVN